MATNVYGNGLNSTAGANTIVHFYDRAGIKAANAMNIYGQFASKKDMPTKFGKTFKISKFLHMYDRSTSDADFAAKGFMTARTADEVSLALTNASLSEGAGAVNKRSLQKVTVETTLARYGEMIDYTDEVDLFSEDYIQVKYREELGELANSRMEDLVQLDMLGTSTVMYAGAATSKGTVGAEVLANGSNDAVAKISYDLIRKAVKKLTRNRAKKNTTLVTGSTKIDTKTVAKSYFAIIGADIKTDLENLTRFDGTYAQEGAYVPVQKYADATNIADGEVGSMYEVRFIESERAVVYAGKGANVPAGYTGTLAYTGTIGTDAKFDVHPILFPTEGAFATVGLKGQGKINFKAKSPEEVELVNPYGTTGFFSYNFFYAGIILEPEKLLAVYCGATR